MSLVKANNFLKKGLLLFQTFPLTYLDLVIFRREQATLNARFSHTCVCVCAPLVPEMDNDLKPSHFKRLVKGAVNHKAMLRSSNRGITLQRNTLGYGAYDTSTRLWEHSTLDSS